MKFKELSPEAKKKAIANYITETDIEIDANSAVRVRTEVNNRLLESQIEFNSNGSIKE